MRYSIVQAITVALTLAIGATAWGTEPEILTMSASEDAGGTTQADLNLQVLKMLERRTVQQLENKTQAYLKAQGQSTQLPKFEAESHYVDTQGRRLAVIRVRVPKAVNQAFVYGIKDSAFLRVACAKTKNFDEAIPLFYGPCSEKIREVFGVSIATK